MKKPKKQGYRKPELRVYGEMEQLTRVMWWGLYPDHLGNLQNTRPPYWMMGMNMMTMS